MCTPKDTTHPFLIPIARFNEWADKDARELFQAAISNESHNMIVTPHFSDKMGINANPATGLIMQGRRFMTPIRCASSAATFSWHRWMTTPQSVLP